MDAMLFVLVLVLVLVALIACAASLVIRVARMGSVKDAVLVVVAFVAIIAGLVGIFGIDVVSAKEIEEGPVVAPPSEDDSELLNSYLPMLMHDGGGDGAVPVLDVQQGAAELDAEPTPVVPVVPVVPCTDCGHNGDHGTVTGPYAGPYPHDGCGDANGPLAKGQDGIAPVAAPAHGDSKK